MGYWGEVEWGWGSPGGPAEDRKRHARPGARAEGHIFRTGICGPAAAGWGGGRSKRGVSEAQGRALSSLQGYFFASAAGAVDGVDDFHGLHAFLAGHQRFAALGDGVAEIPELTFEGFQRNRHWVAGARRDFFGDPRGGAPNGRPDPN